MNIIFSEQQTIKTLNWKIYTFINKQILFKEAQNIYRGADSSSPHPPTLLALYVVTCLSLPHLFWLLVSGIVHINFSYVLLVCPQVHVWVFFYHVANLREPGTGDSIEFLLEVLSYLPILSVVSLTFAWLWAGGPGSILGVGGVETSLCSFVSRQVLGFTQPPKNEYQAWRQPNVGLAILPLVA